MIGSARCSRSEGLTHGCGAAQADDSSAATAARAATVPRKANRRCFMPAPASYLFPDQGSNLIQILAFLAGLVAMMHVAHLAGAVENHGARHPRHLIQLADLAVGVEEYRK